MSVVVSATLVKNFLPDEIVTSDGPGAIRLSRRSPILVTATCASDALPALRQNSHDDDIQLLRRVLLSGNLLKTTTIELKGLGNVTMSKVFNPMARSTIESLRRQCGVPIAKRISPLA